MLTCPKISIPHPNVLSRLPFGNGNFAGLQASKRTWVMEFLLLGVVEMSLMVVPGDVFFLPYPGWDGELPAKIAIRSRDLHNHL